MNIYELGSASHFSDCRRKLFVFISAFILILLTYSNTFNASWHFDDEPNIINRNAIHITELSVTNIKKTFFLKDQIYRPFACLSLALNYYFNGTDVTGYHLVNTSIHFLSTLFLYLLIYQILNLPTLSGRYEKSAHSIALIATFLWAINPVQTQAVTYIIQRMASMAALFYIMAMYFYIKARGAESSLKKTLFFLFCLAAAILAIGSKENAAMLPIALFLLELFLIQGIEKTNLKSNLLVLIALIFLPLLAVLFLRGPSTFDPSFLTAFYEEKPFSLSERMLTEPRIILFYISLLFYPMPERLSISHDISLSQGLFDPPTTILSISAIVLIILICFIKARRIPLISYCVVFFFLNHLMESTVFPLELIFEHRNYLPSILLFVPLAVLIIEGFVFFGKKAYMQSVIAIFTTSLLISYGYSTYIRNFVWQNEGTLWKDAAIKASGLARPHNNLGNYYFRKGLFEKAFIENQKALSGKCLNRANEHHLSYYNLGLEYQRRGNLDLALKYYRISENLKPDYAKLQNNIGTIMIEKGQLNEAAEAFKKAVESDPSDSTYSKNLGYALLEAGLIKEASSNFLKALEVNPNDQSSLKGTGYINRLIGKHGTALIQFQKALRYGPLDPTILLYEAEIYLAKNDNAKVQSLIKKFIENGNEKDLNEYTDGLIRPKGKEDGFKGVYNKKLIQKLLSHELDEKASYLSRKAKHILESSAHIK